MTQAFSRTALVLGDDALIKLQKSHVIVFGVGGVGGYVTEVLIRAGIGELSIVDNDFITESNINRQIIALHSTIGMSKVDVVEIGSGKNLVYTAEVATKPEVTLGSYKGVKVPESRKSRFPKSFTVTSSFSHKHIKVMYIV